MQLNVFVYELWRVSARTSPVSVPVVKTKLRKQNFKPTRTPQTCIKTLCVHIMGTLYRRYQIILEVYMDTFFQYKLYHHIPLTKVNYVKEWENILSFENFDLINLNHQFYQSQ